LRGNLGKKRQLALFKRILGAVMINDGFSQPKNLRISNMLLNQTEEDIVINGAKKIFDIRLQIIFLFPAKTF